MKNVFIVFLGLLIYHHPIFAQRADEQVSDYLDRADWFGLEKVYPTLKDSMQVEFLKEMSEALTDYYFNRLDKAKLHIENLLTKHQAEIGSTNALNMAMLLSIIEGLDGNYQKAAQLAQSLIEQLKAQGTGENAYTHLQQIMDYYACLGDTPGTMAIRPQADVTVPLNIECGKLPKQLEPKGWRGVIIKMPVTIHGKTYRFIFDTGASTTLLSEQLAKEFGVREVNDSLTINSGMIGAKKGKMGVLDSLQIRNITVRNSLIAIIPPNVADTVVKIDAVLGMDIIRQFDEIRIYPQEQKIVFPQTSTPLPASGRNLLFDNQSLKLQAEAGDETLMFTLDTGCSTAGLSSSYYVKHQAELEKQGKKEQVTGMGFNWVQKKSFLRLPSFALSVGETPVILKNLLVELPQEDERPSGDDGLMGMDLLNPFRCVTINLKDMFLKVE